MKPLKIIIPIASVLVLAELMLLVYIAAVPASRPVLSVYIHVLFDKDWKGVTLELKDKQIPVSQSSDGVKLEGYGYSIVIHGYEKAEFQGEKNDYSQRYQIDNKKYVLLNNYAEKDSLDFLDLLKMKDKYSKMVESVAGQINSDYILRYDFLKFSPDDLTLFDDVKNTGVYDSLTFKALELKTVKRLYEYDNGNSKGFEQDWSNKDGNIYNYEVFSENDLNKDYQLLFVGCWTQQEADAAIGTITFDD